MDSESAKKFVHDNLIKFKDMPVSIPGAFVIQQTLIQIIDAMDESGFYITDDLCGKLVNIHVEINNGEYQFIPVWAS